MRQELIEAWVDAARVCDVPTCGQLYALLTQQERAYVCGVVQDEESVDKHERGGHEARAD